MNITVVCAPPVVTEGEDEDTSETGDWNWGIKAHVWGYWVFYWQHQPPYRIFEDEYFDGHRWGGPGVWCIGDMWFIYCMDGNCTFIVVGEADYSTGHLHEDCYHAKCKASSWFENWVGTRWLAETDWAEIQA